ncbi:MAG: DUF512 domain-containing protein [Clostridia bacterium]
MTKIFGFDKGSYAKRAGLKIGDSIVSICGHSIDDILDYIFFDGEENIEIVYVNMSGVQKTVKFKKPLDKSLGIDFGEEFQLTPKRCKNKCLFCFVDQLPKDMRETMYIKDDDYRLSFVSGNYVTLTNISESDIKRIVDYRISPLYISVHAADDQVRKLLVTNPNTAHLMEYMKYFAENGISMHTQVVLCEGINDGAVLKNTLDTLYEMYPSVLSLAVVPVGLTSYRDGLYPLKPLSKQCVEETINTVEKFNEGKNFCWCSDEFYIKAGREIPCYEYYDGFSQIENGVGLVATFRENVSESLLGLKQTDMNGKKIAFITGKSFCGELVSTLESIKQKLVNVEFKVFAINNDFFGDSITVSGLVVGNDILKQVEKGYDAYFLPRNMLKEFESVFLDGITIDEVASKLGKVEVLSALGEDLVQKIIEV